MIPDPKDLTDTPFSANEPPGSDVLPAPAPPESEPKAAPAEPTPPDEAPKP